MDESARKLALEQFVHQWRAKAWEHQARLFTSRHELYRNFIVERHTGTTYGFLAEAVAIALETERLQVMVAATQDQALINKHYLRALVSEKVVSEKVEKWLLKHFCFIAPVQLGKALIGQPAWDVYVADYLWLSNKAVDEVRWWVKHQVPVRQIWVTTLPDHPKYSLLLKANPV